MDGNPAIQSLLHLNLGLDATPIITFVKPFGVTQPIATGAEPANGFALELDAVFPFEKLSTVLSGILLDKRITLSEGLLKQHLVVKACKLYSNGDNLVAAIEFCGSFSGTLYATGKPYYNEATQTISLQQFNYDLKTSNFLLKGAKWLFDKLIREEIQKYTIADLSAYHKKITDNITNLLNKEWTKGLQASGTVESLTVTGIQVQQQQLMVCSRCSGRLSLQVTEGDFNM